MIKNLAAIYKGIEELIPGIDFKYAENKSYKFLRISIACCELKSYNGACE
jgi:hypothetical protein